MNKAKRISVSDSAIWLSKNPIAVGLVISNWAQSDRTCPNKGFGRAYRSIVALDHEGGGYTATKKVEKGVSGVKIVYRSRYHGKRGPAVEAFIPDSWIRNMETKFAPAEAED